MTVFQSLSYSEGYSKKLEEEKDARRNGGCNRFGESLSFFRFFLPEVLAVDLQSPEDLPLSFVCQAFQFFILTVKEYNGGQRRQLRKGQHRTQFHFFPLAGC